MIKIFISVLILLFSKNAISQDYEKYSDKAVQKMIFKALNVNEKDLRDQHESHKGKTDTWLYAVARDRMKASPDSYRVELGSHRIFVEMLKATAELIDQTIYLSQEHGTLPFRKVLDTAVDIEFSVRALRDQVRLKEGLPLGYINPDRDKQKQIDEKLKKTVTDDPLARKAIERFKKAVSKFLKDSSHIPEFKNARNRLSLLLEGATVVIPNELEMLQKLGLYGKGRTYTETAEMMEKLERARKRVIIDTNADKSSKKPSQNQGDEKVLETKSPVKKDSKKKKPKADSGL